MRDPNRIPVMLEVIRQIWTANPDLRLGQLIGNSIDDVRRLYYLEDDKMLANLEDCYGKFEDYKLNMP